MLHYTFSVSLRPYILMRITGIAPYLVLTLWLGVIGQVSAQTQALQTCLEKASTPLAQAECFRGIPYRPDGALDEQGRWTSWAKQNQTLTSPGLNCSGLTAAASRAILGQTLSLDTIQRDRLGDSGPDSSMGQDWDFGLDVILNLTEGFPRRLIPNPYAQQPLDSTLWNAHDLKGVDTESIEFENILSQIQPDHIYYFVISRHDSKFKGGLSFYHVGFILKDGTQTWMYHATGKGGVYRINLASEKGFAWFKRYYGASAKGSKYIQFIEVPLVAQHTQ